MNYYDVLDVYPHNRKGYEKVEEHWKEERLAALIRATGTGKTIVAMLSMLNRKKTKYYVCSTLSVDYRTYS